MAEEEKKGSRKTTKKLEIKAETPKQAPKHEIVAVSELLPPNLFLVPVSQTTLFPGMIVPLIFPEGKLSETIAHSMEKDGYIGVVLTKSSGEDDTIAMGPPTSITGLPAQGTLVKPAAETEFHPYGVAAKILKKINLPDNQVSVLLTGVQRFQIKDVVTREPHYVAHVKYLPDVLRQDTELEALLRSALGQFKQLSKDNPLISEEVKVALVNIDGPSKLADLMASVLVRDVNLYQELLKLADVKERLQHLLLLLKREADVQLVQKKIQDEINGKVATTQREYYLQEQLKMIQKELGQHQDERSRLVDKFKLRLKDKVIHPEAKTRLDEEFEKLESLHEQSSEFSVAVNYLDWATSLPWGIRSQENRELKAAKKILDEDHFGLKDVKARILEFLAVKRLKNTNEGSIICFVGPPGTGKTSMGKSIARALNRKFFRFSVGGMRDEAEIKGHRRTYVGAMPGKVVQGLKRVSTQNPVFLIDEIDKIGSGFSTGGDPASALLEVLDPEQNLEFLDHYLDIPYDCSEVFFITTANTVDTIPDALLDRMEVIELHGYTDNEKFEIAKRHLIPKQLEKAAIKANQLKITDNALRYIVARYAREAGVRNLEKQIAKLCRKVAYRIAMGKTEKTIISDPKVIEKHLGLPPFELEKEDRKIVPGVAKGLAWTYFGGDVLTVESSVVRGKGGITLTGSLGDVMQESANIAYTFVRGQSRKLRLSKDFFEENAVHVHVPAGATPKDGPSAGITIATSLYSLLSKKPILPKLAMTGELTLSGKVLPVGGIKEKLLAARRNGIKTVLLPHANAKDLKDLEPEVKSGLKILFVESMDQVLRKAFLNS